MPTEFLGQAKPKVWISYRLAAQGKPASMAYCASRMSARDRADAPRRAAITATVRLASIGDRTADMSQPSRPKGHGHRSENGMHRALMGCRACDPPRLYPDPPFRISTMLRFMVATEGSSLSLNSSDVAPCLKGEALLLPVGVLACELAHKPHDPRSRGLFVDNLVAELQAPTSQESSTLVRQPDPVLAPSRRNAGACQPRRSNHCASLAFGAIMASRSFRPRSEIPERNRDESRKPTLSGVVRRAKAEHPFPLSASARKRLGREQETCNSPATDPEKLLRSDLQRCLTWQERASWSLDLHIQPLAGISAFGPPRTAERHLGA